MASAIDVFREQPEAAEQLHARVQEVAVLVGQVRQQVNALALSDDLRAVLRQEQDWLTRAQLAISEVRSFREQDMVRFWPGVIRRWAVALVFALVSAAAGGAGYAWWTKPYAAELAVLRARLAFADFVEHRVLTMTPTRTPSVRHAHDAEIIAAVRQGSLAFSNPLEQLVVRSYDRMQLALDELGVVNGRERCWLFGPCAAMHQH